MGTKFPLRRLSDGWRVEIGKISLLLKTALFMCQALKENIKPAVSTNCVRSLDAQEIKTPACQNKLVGTQYCKGCGSMKTWI